MKIFVIAPILLSVLVLFASACQADAVGSGSLAGNWTGDSICMVRPSPCNDEKVIYHISEPDNKGKFQIRADKIVDGKPEFMGTLDCTFDKQHSAIACPMSYGLWEFVVSGASMNGTLKLPDGTLYRRVSVKKDEK